MQRLDVAPRQPGRVRAEGKPQGRGEGGGREGEVVGEKKVEVEMREEKTQFTR